jgi:lipopolysaccharide transport system permease protein
MLSLSLPVPPPEAYEPFERAWRHRELIRAVARREFISRFRGSALGPLWAVLSPLIMMLTYTVVFSITVPQLAAGKSITDYAAGIFIGLIVFNLFSELAYRAPMLLHEHVNFVKKSIFPSETIAWTATIRAFTYGGIAFLVFLVFRLFTGGALHWSLLFTPFLVIPFALMILGVVWFFMALGAFTRDVAHIMASIVPILMFATPVFYSLDQLPAGVAIWLRLNLIGDYIEMFRAITLEGRLPNLFGYLAIALLSYAIFWGGYQFFMRYKSVIVDVI